MSQALHRNSKKDCVYLIDGSGYIFRAYHALPPLSRQDGTPVGAVYGFVTMLLRQWEDLKGHKVLVVFDASRRTFRQDIYPHYKAHRPPPPEDLIPQFGLIREACAAMGLPYVEDTNFEADDLIATYAHILHNEGCEVVIISGDKDLMQLVKPDVLMLDPIKNKLLGPAEVKEKFGVLPDKVVEVQALAGDSVDNVPGVPGIGIKTAAELINQFGSLENLLDQAHTIKQPKRREKLLENKEAVLISRKLVTLSLKAPMPMPLQDIPTLETLATDQALAFMKAQNFKAMLVKLQHEGQPIAPKTPEPAHQVAPKAPLAFETEIISHEEQLATWRDAIQESGRVAVDTETTGLDAQGAGLVGISLAIPGTPKAAYIPLMHRADLLAEETYTQLPLSLVCCHLGPLLKDSAILKIGQNIKFDKHILARHGLDITPYADTMLMSYLIYGHVQNHGLDALAKQHFNYDMLSFKELTKDGRGQKTFDEVPIADAAFYAAEDAFVTAELYLSLLPLLPAHQAVTVYETLERPLIQVLYAMEKAGVLLDIPHLKTLGAQLEQQLQTLQHTIYNQAGSEFNLSSPQQLSHVLFDQLALPPQGRKGKTGAYSTNVDVLEALKDLGHNIADDILRWRQLMKLQSTYTDALINQANKETNRVHTSYGMVTTSTGRLSSSAPNLQNIPIRTEEGRLIRQAFVAPGGCQLMSFDYSQIELRLLAHMANITPLIEAFKHGADIHRKTASEVFKTPLEAITPDQRRNAKAINFGIIYGMSAFGLSKQLGIPRDEAQSYIEAYFAAYPGIKSYMSTIIQQAQEQGHVTTLFGRRSYTPDINDRNPQRRQMAERQAINAPLQGTAADIIKAAMIQIHQRLPASGIEARMLLQVHDELVFEVPTAQIEKAGPFIKGIMESVIKLKVPLVVDYGAGPNWEACH